MKKIASMVLATIVAICGNVHAQSYELPLDIALHAAQGAVKFCNAQGYHIGAAVVDRAGALRVFLRADGSTVHVKDTAFRKAYTVITLGPIFKFDRSSQAAAAFNGKPSEPSFLTIPDIALLPGAVAIKANGSIVAALGVGGAPGGEKDEACAAAGVQAIATELSGSGK
ncbi:heme-binding protein [Dyella sp. M7H15-1]|uniref:GlcG/HbpS family heme-binding protein n=1 Tax=Dyella sp. M7H15-1 TaxID=2501295 RepID=UPI0013E8B702|nr:heme-binding protein [Dyella sp. M7H15-1]